MMKTVINSTPIAFHRSQIVVATISYLQLDYIVADKMKQYKQEIFRYSCAQEQSSHYYL